MITFYTNFKNGTSTRNVQGSWVEMPKKRERKVPLPLDFWTCNEPSGTQWCYDTAPGASRIASGGSPLT